MVVVIVFLLSLLCLIQLPSLAILCGDKFVICVCFRIVVAESHTTPYSGHLTRSSHVSTCYQFLDPEPLWSGAEFYGVQIINNSLVSVCRTPNYLFLQVRLLTTTERTSGDEKYVFERSRPC